MRIVLVDPLAYSLPYDHGLASALARRGHDVELVTAPFAFGAAPEPEGYRRSELFAPLSGRLFRGAPRSSARRAVAAAEYAPSALRLLRHARAARPEVVHVQWLPRPRLDLAWLRRLPRPLVFTAHNALPRDPRDLPARRATLRLVDRVVVHSRRAVEQAVELGAERERVVWIPHGVWAPRVDAPPPPGRTVHSRAAMASQAFLTWQGQSAEHLDELFSAHARLGGTAPGRRYATAQLNASILVQVAAHFQLFCRDLHTEAAQALVAAAPAAYRSMLRVAFTNRRGLDRGNASPETVAADFARFDLDIFSAQQQALLTGTSVTLPWARRWRSACNGLARTFDAVVADHVAAVAGPRPW